MKTKITFLETTFIAVMLFTTSLAINAQDALLRYTFENVITNGGTAGAAGDLIISPDVSGSPIYTPGPAGLGKVYQGDGNNSLETSWGDITGHQPRTITAWVKTNTDGTAKTIVTLGSRPKKGANGMKFFFGVDPNNKLKIGITGDSFTHSTSLTEDVWTFVVVTHDGSESIGMTGTTLYVDTAAEVGNTTKSVIVNTVNLDPVRTLIGSQWKKNNINYNFTTAAMDDIRVFDYELTPAQLATVKSGGTLGVKDIGFAPNELKAFPNSVNDFLNIETSVTKKLEVTVYDIYGKLLKRSYGKHVDMRGLSSGVYILKVRAGAKVASVKIIKE